MKYYFTFLLSQLLLSQGCNNSKSKEATETVKQKANTGSIQTKVPDIQFTLPPHWFRTDTIVNEAPVCLLMKGNPDDNFKPIINTNTEYMNGRTHQEYMVAAQSGLTSIVTGVELLKKGELEISGNKCLWYNYYRTRGEIKRYMIFYSIPVNGTAYTITAAVNAEGLEKYRPIFDQIVQSFRLVN